MKTAIIILLIGAIANVACACRTLYIMHKEKKHYKKLKEELYSKNKENVVKEMFEFLRTRAFSLENVKDLNENEAFPLWININEVYNILSMYETGKLDAFLKEQWNNGYYDWGCDADDIDFPEFPSK